MDASNIDEKYKKLASEYSKLRAQAGVLKRAVLEEQNKNATLRETVRVKETNLRRVEQEVDSLGFRNKQLEYRVASLQDDLSKDATKKSGKNIKSKDKDKTMNPNALLMPTDASSVISEEFQKKILECGQLTSTLADKMAENQLQANRIEELEHLVRSMNAEQTETEAKLRREVERLTVKTHELEAKLADATSIVGSDDTLYVSELEQQRSNNSSTNNGTTKFDERILKLEKELIHWRTQYEILQMKGKFDNSNANAIDQNKIENDNNKHSEHKNEKENEKLTPTLSIGEQLLVDNYSKKIEDLLMSKCLAESKLVIYEEEVDSLQKHVSIINNDLKELERKLRESQRNLQLADEDLATTRINYEEQISVLTEQLISLSDRLAELK